MPDEPAEPENRGTPFTPEDGLYQGLVSNYMGLQRAGADPFGAALITAAILVLSGTMNVLPHERDEGESPK